MRSDHIDAGARAAVISPISDKLHALLDELRRP